MQMNIMQEQKTTHMTPAESPRSERRCYTVDEVMEFLGVGRKAVYSLIHRRAFPSIRINNLGYRIPKESFNSCCFRSEAAGLESSSTASNFYERCAIIFFSGLKRRGKSWLWTRKQRPCLSVK